MQWLTALGFANPLALWGLAALPVIWWLLRFTPPRPQTVRFPPLRILLQLRSEEESPDKTPWWLLLLRLALAAVLIVAVAQPLLRKNASLRPNSGPLLLIVDDGWAAAKSWPKRLEALQSILTQADGRVVTMATTTPGVQPADLRSVSAGNALTIARTLQPQALGTDRLALLEQIKSQQVKASSITWLSDGLDAGSAQTFVGALTALYGSDLTTLILEKGDTPLVLAKPTVEGGDINVAVLRNDNAATTAKVQATASNGRILAEAPVNFNQAKTTTVKLELPLELRNEIQSISIVGENHAGARQLLDDRWRRKTIAIQTGVSQEEAQPLLSPLHYVKNALEPFAEIKQPATSTDLKADLEAGLSMLILADIGKIPQDVHDPILQWIEKGGVLLRFAGPRLASTTDDLMPVRLREGDRNLGSALSWETPQVIQTLSDKSPFGGIAIDSQIKISRQVLAEPDTALAEKTWVSLADGTPLVTAAPKGKGLIILFHVTANADWSNLPLSGMFVDMLQRMVDLAPNAGSNTAVTARPEDAPSFTSRLLLSGTGELVAPTTKLSAIPQDVFERSKASPKTPAGLYVRGGQERAINLDLTAADLKPILGLNLEKVTPPQTTNLAPYFFIAAAALFLLDSVAALLLGGGFMRRAGQSTAALLLPIALLVSVVPLNHAHADDQSAMQATLQTRLAYVKTGDVDIDQTSEKGLNGLGLIMADRTSAILGDPVGLNIETDELVFYPLLYWPVTESAGAPSAAALARIDAFMKNGGTILFDLRDNSAGFGSVSATGEALKRILANLDIPPLETVPVDHVLTRSFYLLNSFPGRYTDGALWVEAQNAETASKSDGVSGIIIGSNDYAAAWALDDRGQPLNALIPGDDRQRETAFRVGVNIVMYALTGNYKTDQVHIPALLERLGQ